MKFLDVTGLKNSSKLLQGSTVRSNTKIPQQSYHFSIYSTVISVFVYQLVCFHYVPLPKLYKHFLCTLAFYKSGWYLRFNPSKYARLWQSWRSAL